MMVVVVVLLMAIVLALAGSKMILKVNGRSRPTGLRADRSRLDNTDSVGRNSRTVVGLAIAHKRRSLGMAERLICTSTLLDTDHGAGSDRTGSWDNH